LLLLDYNARNLQQQTAGRFASQHSAFTSSVHVNSSSGKFMTGRNADVAVLTDSDVGIVTVVSKREKAFSIKNTHTIICEHQGEIG
jgi:hypothetical protein